MAAAVQTMAPLPTMGTSSWEAAFTPQQPKTTTRRQRLNALLALPAPHCASTEWKYECFKICWMLRELIDTDPKSTQEMWKQELLAEALRTLHTIDDPTESPVAASRTDYIKWADVMMRRLVTESLWEADSTVSFHDCCEQLEVGRSKAAAFRLFHQAKSSWATITQTDIRSEFSLSG